MKLTEAQIAAAKQLLAERPPVYDGTRVVIDNTARNKWYEKVKAACTKYSVSKDQRDAFCDIAGVPD